MRYAGKHALVTGGLGFIGSNLVIRLVEEGAHVTVVDNLLPGCGGNLFNVAPVRDRISVLNSDIADISRDVIAGADVIFNLAGEISHIHSMQFPERDLQVNTLSQLRFLLACAEARRGVRIVYAGTRQVYGVPKYLPVDEAHPLRPVDFNGVHKLAATLYHLMMSRIGHLDGIVLRLTNVYGPRMALDVVCQGFMSTYLRNMVLKQPLQVFGDGEQLRDPMYVGDAVEAFLLAGSAPKHIYRTYNAGGPAALTMKNIAGIAANIAGLPEPSLVSFPNDRKPIDIGSYRTDNRRIEREFGWTAAVPLAEGLHRTYNYYRIEGAHYLDADNSNRACGMPEHSGVTRKLSYTRVQ
jgi:nucleoside-diphosphate-sugar epimerase